MGMPGVYTIPVFFRIRGQRIDGQTHGEDSLHAVAQSVDCADDYRGRHRTMCEQQVESQPEGA
jgi:hypothetical protein